MDTIPLEIGAYIASRIGHRRDVATLCLASSQWLEAARPTLYKHLQLELNSKTIEATLEILRRNPRVMRSVTALQLGSDQIKGWPVFADTLRGMQNVQLLHLWGRFSVSSIKSIAAIFYEIAPNLEKVVLNVHSYVHSEEEESHDLETLQNVPHELKFLRIECSDISIRLLRTTFLHRPSSITTLELFNTTGKDSRMAKLLPIIRLPNLETFKMTRIEIENSPEPILLNFLVAHPTIQTFSAISSECLDLCIRSSQCRNLLPNLKYLCANYAVVKDLSKICPSTIENLISLEFKNFAIDAEDEHIERSFLSDMEHIIRHIGTFPYLQHFTLEDTKSKLIATLFKTMSRVAPLVEHISISDISFNNEEQTHDEVKISRLFEAAECFTRLQRLDFHSKILLPSSLIIPNAQNNKTIRLIYLFSVDAEHEDTLIERKGDPAHSLIFNTFDQKSSRIWWMM